MPVVNRCLVKCFRLCKCHCRKSRHGDSVTSFQIQELADNLLCALFSLLLFRLFSNMQFSPKSHAIKRTNIDFTWILPD